MSKYDDMTVAEIVYDFGYVRGDLSEESARRQLVSAIHHKMMRARGATRGLEYEAFLRGLRTVGEVDSAEVHKALANAWDEGFRHAPFRHDSELIGLESDNPYRTEGDQA